MEAPEAESDSTSNTVEGTTPSLSTEIPPPVVKVKKPRSDAQKAAFERAKTKRLENLATRKTEAKRQAIREVIESEGYILPQKQATTTQKTPQKSRKPVVEIRHEDPITSESDGEMPHTQPLEKARHKRPLPSASAPHSQSAFSINFV
jgi:hypothetical protein